MSAVNRVNPGLMPTRMIQITFALILNLIQHYLQEHLMEEMKNSNANHTIQTQEEKINS